MGKDKLQNLKDRSKVIDIDNNSKFVLFSDCHRGNGTYKDALYPNVNIYLTALRYYYNNGYSYLELGDGDELWKFTNFSDIVEAHRDEYKILESFKKENRLYMIYGNHDGIKGSRRFKRYIEKYKEKNKLLYSFYSDLNIYEGIILKYKNLKEYFLFHGHQFDFACDEMAPVTKILVRYIWGFLTEVMSFKEITSPAKFDNKRERIDKKAYEWSRKNKINIIMGHTHNSIFLDDDSNYMNTGAAVLPYSVTCIELENGIFTLCKWTITSIKGGFLVVRKESLGKPKFIE